MCEVFVLRVIIQRCSKARVEVDEKVIGSINQGLSLLVGFTKGDSDKEIDYLVDKIINLRIFDDENGVMNKSLLDISGEILSISQFTLYGDCRKGRRPSYIKSLNGKDASVLYDKFNKKLSSNNIKVETGMFGANMKIYNICDGPVTITLEKENKNG
jgi:D-tyrosyl-tRNA(Tyr) deacylase